MDNGDLESGAQDVSRPSAGRRYRPVVDNDRAVLEMSSLDSGSSSSSSAAAVAPVSNHQSDVKKVTLNDQVKVHSGASGGARPANGGSNGLEREHKLELFGFDSLVSILGLRSMTGEEVTAPSSPRNGEDGNVMYERLRANNVKLGTMMGVFLPCFQSILGIIFYIRFSWIVGMAGIGQSLVLVAFCGLCTLLTGISLSAIATNGAMKVKLT
uniref:Uncharacterized protein MANES_06G060500 n=1 Tax=Rhizophora mucronata TaxID=61149 RepID=A0A2P2IQ39_RHIMU